MSGVTVSPWLLAILIGLSIPTTCAIAAFVWMLLTDGEEDQT